MGAKADTGSLRHLVRNLQTMDQVPKEEHERLKAIEAAARFLFRSVHDGSSYKLAAFDPIAIRAMRKALAKTRGSKLEDQHCPADAIGL